MTETVAACIPTIPPRRQTLLGETLASVLRQSHQPDEILVVSDTERAGSWVTRNRLAGAASSTWLAFLDDDDLIYPDHVRLALEAAEAQRADVVLAQWEPDGMLAPMPLDWALGRVNPNGRTFGLSSAFMVRRELARGIPFRGDPAGPLNGDVVHAAHDWRDHGARFVVVTVPTWRWRGHANRTGGQPSRWSAEPHARAASWAP